VSDDKNNILPPGMREMPMPPGLAEAIAAHEKARLEEKPPRRRWWRRRHPERWYAVPDDLIGGWCVMTADKRPSEVVPGDGVVQIADFVSMADARYVARLHNRRRRLPWWAAVESFVIGGLASLVMQWLW